MTCGATTSSTRKMGTDSAIKCPTLSNNSKQFSFRMPKVSLNHVWSMENRLGSSDKRSKLFSEIKTFFGKKFKILAIPEGRVLQGTFLTEEESRHV